MTLTAGIIAAIIGLIGGIIGTLVAPWVNWGIEKRKIKLQRRKELIEMVRNQLLFTHDIRIGDIKRDRRYLSIKHFLSEKLVNDIENGVVKDGANYGPDHIRNRIYQEISVLEKKWGL